MVVSAVLVVAPIAAAPQIQYFYALLFILAGLIFYVPFVYYEKTVPGIGLTSLLFLCIFIWLSLLYYDTCRPIYDISTKTSESSPDNKPLKSKIRKQQDTQEFIFLNLLLLYFKADKLYKTKQRRFSFFNKMRDKMRTLSLTEAFCLATFFSKSVLKHLIYPHSPFVQYFTNDWVACLDNKLSIKLIRLVRGTITGSVYFSNVGLRRDGRLL